MISLARSVTSSRSSVQAPVERYFHPPSADTTTMEAACPSGRAAAHFTAPASAAPVEMPGEDPHFGQAPRPLDRLPRPHDGLAIESSAPPSSSKMGGMYPSSRLRRPSTISPAGGSTAQI